MAELPVPSARSGRTPNLEGPFLTKPPPRWGQVEWFVLPMVFLAVPLLMVAVAALTLPDGSSADSSSAAAPNPGWFALGMAVLVTEHPWWVVGFFVAWFIAPIVPEALRYVLHSRRAAPKLDGDPPDHELGWARWASGPHLMSQMPGAEPDDGWAPTGRDGRRLVVRRR